MAGMICTGGGSHIVLKMIVTGMSEVQPILGPNPSPSLLCGSLQHTSSPSPYRNRNRNPNSIPIPNPNRNLSTNPEPEPNPNPNTNPSPIPGPELSRIERILRGGAAHASDSSADEDD